MRPVQRAGLEAGWVSAMTVIMDPRRLEWLFEFKTEPGDAETDRGSEKFRGVQQNTDSDRGQLTDPGFGTSLSRYQVLSQRRAVRRA